MPASSISRLKQQLHDMFTAEKFTIVILNRKTTTGKYGNKITKPSYFYIADSTITDITETLAQVFGHRLLTVNNTHAISTKYFSAMGILTHAARHLSILREDTFAGKIRYL